MIHPRWFLIEHFSITLQISLRGWCQLSGPKIKIEHRAEDACGALSIGNLQLSAYRSSESEIEANNQGTLSIGSFQSDDLAAENWIVSIVCERLQRCRLLAAPFWTGTVTTENHHKFPIAIWEIGDFRLYHTKHGSWQWQLAYTIWTAEDSYRQTTNGGDHGQWW